MSSCLLFPIAGWNRVLSHPSTHLRSSSQDKINGMNAAVLEQMSLPKHKRKREYRMATMDDITLKKIWNLVGTHPLCKRIPCSIFELLLMIDSLSI